MRLRFTIRDLLWLTLVVALAVGWLTNRARMQIGLNDQIKQRQHAEDELKSLEMRNAFLRDQLNQRPSGVIFFPGRPTAQNGIDRR